MKKILVSDAETGLGVPEARLGYLVNARGRLTREGTPPRAELMLLAAEENVSGDARALASQVLAELAQRGFKGLVADLGESGREFFSEALLAMSEPMRARGLRLYVPEAYAPVAEHARLIVSTAVSGGSLRALLSEKAARWGAGRLAAEVERVRMLFSMPARSGEGVSLTADELLSIRKKHRPACFFSKPLCAYYFTYMDETGRPRFALFDDAVSLRRKMELAAELGVGECFLLYDEVRDVWEAIV